MSGRSGQAIQQPACGSNSAGIRKPSSAGVDFSVTLIALYLEPVDEIRLIRAEQPPESLARTRAPSRPPFRIAAVQHRWHPDPEEHEAALEEGIRDRGRGGSAARLPAGADPEPLLRGRPGRARGRRAPSRRSCPAAAPSSSPPAWPRPTASTSTPPSTSAPTPTTASASTPRSSSRPAGELVARTRKLHIPVTAGYHEDRYFRPGPGDADAFPLVGLGEVSLGLPTCWDQWFPEVARAYSLEGADVLVYPTAIGSEPDHPEFDTQPLWQQVIVGNGIANGVFMVAVNRIGTEPPLTFYGSSFISDPYGRILAQAPRDEPAVLVADLDLDQRRDWLELFPFLTTRRPAPRRLRQAEAGP